MRSKNVFYILFYLAVCVAVLGYLCINKKVVLEPQQMICLAVAAFSVSVASLLSQIADEFHTHKTIRILLELLIYSFMGFTMVALVVFPLVIQVKDAAPLGNALTLWSLALIFLSNVLKEWRTNLALKRKVSPKIEGVPASAPMSQEKMRPQTEG